MPTESVEQYRLTADLLFNQAPSTKHQAPSTKHSVSTCDSVFQPSTKHSVSTCDSVFHLSTKHVTTAIRIENVSKLYRLGTVGTGTMAHDLNRWWHQIRGKEDPYAKVGQVNDRTKSSTRDEEPGTKNGSSGTKHQAPSTKNGAAPDYVWALKDINLEVAQGEILGIIGRNGAGKSTLLKLLSRVTAPTTGAIKTKGRIASLLEVGTGFHPDLTGRENIYMNGAILGMRRYEITRQLDEIVEFSGCAKYLDTPVKRYSSGMTVRLGFAVAAHLRCEVLIVDEVLAVGDAEFQNKCLGQMQKISNGGRTVLFVSHNMNSLARLCESAVLLQSGGIHSVGRISEVIPFYLSQQRSLRDTPKAVSSQDGQYDVELTSVSVEDEASVETFSIPFSSPWQIRVRIRVNRRIDALVVAIGMSTEDGVPLRTSWSNPKPYEIGDYEVVFREETVVFAPRAYFADVGLSVYNRNIHYVPQAVSFDICRLKIAGEAEPYSVSDAFGLIASPFLINITRT